MSRLDSFIRRLQAQRACLDLAVELTAGVSGPALELGLGNGRTYDHLREHLPDRDIYVFDRQVAAHPDCIPPDGRMLLGDFRDTVPAARQRIGEPAALIHADIGSGDKTATAALAADLSPWLEGLLASGGVLVSDQPLHMPACTGVALPEGVAPGRYHIYRKTDGDDD